MCVLVVIIFLLQCACCCFYFSLVCVSVVVAASCVTGVLPVLTLQREPQVVREGCACG